MMGAEVCSTNLTFPSLSPSGGAVHGKLREVYPCRENVDCVSWGGGGPLCRPPCSEEHALELWGEQEVTAQL